MNKLIDFWHRYSQTGVYTVLSVFACFCIATLYFMFWEPSYLSYPETIKPLVDTVAPGEVLPVVVHRISKDRLTRSYTSTRELHCDSLKVKVLMTVWPNQVESGDHTVPSMNLVIPATVTDDMFDGPRLLPNGLCYVSGEAETQGLIRAILVPWRTEPFHVVRKTEE